MSQARVAFFTDSYHEVNGVALTSWQFAEFARERQYPFLSVHVGPTTRSWREGEFETLELVNSRAFLDLDKDLKFDLLFLRHYWRVLRTVRMFRPDIVHITGPGHCGLLGAMAAYRLRIPMAASWHTNLHEYAGRRLGRVLRRWPLQLRQPLVSLAESGSLKIAAGFYKLANVLFAPNPELTGMLEKQTGRPAHLMSRGIDASLFSPHRRERHDDAFVIGFVGRLSPEKNIRLLAQIERSLLAAGISHYRFLVVGEGSDREWLRQNMQRCELPGILRGAELARAYAGMDLFVFPSETDTFGNVVVEAMASGVPAIVSNAGGPKYLVEPGVSGFVAADAGEFSSLVLRVLNDRTLLRDMSANALRRSARFSWPAVFDDVYRHYETAFEQRTAAAPRTTVSVS